MPASTLVSKFKQRERMKAIGADSFVSTLYVFLGCYFSLGLVQAAVSRVVPTQSGKCCLPKRIWSRLVQPLGEAP